MSGRDDQPSIGTSGGLLAGEDVLPQLAGWSARGARCALVTLIGQGGPGPRPLGAQMAVHADGRYVGYLSGGCLETAIVGEAQAAIAEARNRRVRFGGPDGYFDLALPCGSRIEVLIDQGLEPATLAAMQAARAARRPFALSTGLVGGRHLVEVLPAPRDGAALPPSGLVERAAGGPAYPGGPAFRRVHQPVLRLLLVGSSPVVDGLARLAACVGFDLTVLTPQAALAASLADAAIGTRHLARLDRIPDAVRPDPWTASVLAFHEHDSEPALLADLLAAPGFYVGALGSRGVHAHRVEAMRRLGVPAARLDRLRGPIGLVPGAKTQAALALGVLGEIVAEARRLALTD